MNSTVQALEKLTDNDTVKLITKAQNMARLRTAEIEEDRFPLVMRAIYGLFMRK